MTKCIFNYSEKQKKKKKISTAALTLEHKHEIKTCAPQPWDVL